VGDGGVGSGVCGGIDGFASQAIGVTVAVILAIM
jgi:hypothetical protein